MKILLALTFWCAVSIPGICALSLEQQLEMAESEGRTLSQIEIIRRMLESGMDSPELRASLVDLWLKARDFDMAEKALAEWKEAPAEITALTRAEILVQREEKPLEAAVTLREYLAGEPDSIPASEVLVDLLWRADEWGQLADFLGTSPLTSSSPDFLIRRAQALKNLGNYQGALADAESARNLDPENSTVKNSMPSFERLAVAVPKLEETRAVLEASPSDLRALVLESYWRDYADLSGDEDYQLARRAWEANPDSMAARLSAGLRAGLSREETLRTHGVSKEAPEPDEQTWLALLRLDAEVSAKPGRAEPLVKRAYFLNDAPAQYELGLADANAALLIDPENVGALTERLYSLVMLKRPNESAAAFLALEGANPGRESLATGLRYLAEIETQEGRLQSAMDLLTRSIELEDSGAARRSRATVYQRLGLPEEARADLTRAAQLEQTTSR